MTEDNCIDCGKHRSELAEPPWWNPKGILCKPCREIRVQKQIAEFQASGKDTDYEDEPTCPNCGKTHGDAWELSDDTGEIECGNCNAKYAYDREIQVTYSTKLIAK